MKTIASITTLGIIMLALIACASKPIPDWKNDSFNRLENFKKFFLTGDEKKADIYFSKSVKAIKKSGNLSTLAQAYLTKYAVRVAALDTIDGNEFATINDLEPSRMNKTFYAFLTGDTNNVDAQVLPQRYRNFFTAFAGGTVDDINNQLALIEDPLALLIATGISVQHHRYNETTLKSAVAVTSKYGWKRALINYMEFSATFYERIGEAATAERIRGKIELIKK